MMDDQGGFGRFQLFQYLVIMAGINSYGWLLYSMGYLLLFPEFKCHQLEGGKWIEIDKGSDEYNAKCVPSYFCKAEGLKYEIVEESQMTLNNWMNKYDLICASSQTLGMFGMSYFMGFAIGSLCLPYYADQIGRKRMYLVSLLMCIVSMSVPFVLTDSYNNIYVLYCCMLLGGISSGGRYPIGFCYFQELAPRHHCDILATLFSVSEGVIYVYVTLYYKYVSKDWRG